MQKGTYNFIVGVKTPLFANYPVTANLHITVEGLEGILEVPLRQLIVVPTVTCSK